MAPLLPNFLNIITNVVFHAWIKYINWLSFFFLMWLLMVLHESGMPHLLINLLIEKPCLLEGKHWEKEGKLNHLGEWEKIEEKKSYYSFPSFPFPFYFHCLGKNRWVGKYMKKWKNIGMVRHLRWFNRVIPSNISMHQTAWK